MQLGVTCAAAKQWQDDADAITRLLVRELLTEKERIKARKRLAKIIEVELGR